MATGEPCHVTDTPWHVTDASLTRLGSCTASGYAEVPTVEGCDAAARDLKLGDGASLRGDANTTVTGYFFSEPIETRHVNYSASPRVSSILMRIDPRGSILMRVPLISQCLMSTLNSHYCPPPTGP